MEQFFDFMEKYFIYIWLVLAVTTISILFIRGRKALKPFTDLDLSNLVYSEKWASGYSTKSFKTRWGGASKLLHIMISYKELILKTNLFIAYIAKESDLLHRIPLENILKTEIKKGLMFSRLYVEFKGLQGETKEIVLMSKNNKHIREILQKKLNPCF